MTDPTAPPAIPVEDPQPAGPPEGDPAPPLEEPPVSPPAQPGDWRPHD